MQSPDPVPNPETMSQPMDTTNDALDHDALDDDDREWVDSPVDDLTYDLLMALASKLEAIDTYQVYAEDGQPELWRELATDERRHAERLFNELKQRFAAS
ncbi:MAG TPA: hypothetical protein VM427_07990 [Patescibacteria group bacterium]|nr:hypothetical protein [Patescibacteria group bacterium]